MVGSKASENWSGDSLGLSHYHLASLTRTAFTQCMRLHTSSMIYAHTAPREWIFIPIELIFLDIFYTIEIAVFDAYCFAETYHVMHLHWDLFDLSLICAVYTSLSEALSMTFTLMCLVRIRAEAFKVKSIFLIMVMFTYALFFLQNAPSDKSKEYKVFPIPLSKTWLSLAAPSCNTKTNHTNILSLDQKHSKAPASDLRPRRGFHENCLKSRLQCQANI